MLTNQGLLGGELLFKGEIDLLKLLNRLVKFRLLHLLARLLQIVKACLNADVGQMSG